MSNIGQGLSGPTGYEITETPGITHIDQYMADKARAYLRRQDAEDLAEMLGLKEDA